MLLLALACRENIGVADVGALIGEACQEQATCADGLVCAHDGTCQLEDTPGTYLVGDECLHAEECALDLVCDTEGQCAEPGASGTGQADDPCEADDDCALGLVCAEGVCEDLGVPYWEGVSCVQDEGAFRMYTQVPSLPEEGTVEFYRMPFASDARVLGEGHLDLSGHASPNETVDAWLAGAEEPVDLGLTPTVIFRASGRLDASSVVGMSDDATLFMADVDDDSEDFGSRGSFVWRVNSGRSRYHCDDWIAVEPFPGVPLSPDGTYAVWLTDGLKSSSGESAGRDPDLDVLLAGESPGDARLLNAWNGWKPLRDYFTTWGIDSDEVVAAAVLSTGSPARRVLSIEPRLDGQAVAAELPELVDCSASPCGGECSASVTELHGQLALPTFQDEQGHWDWDDFGKPTLRGEELACLAMTIPDDAEDPPIVIVVQDEGAGFRDWVDSGLAEELAAEGYAAISLALPHHDGRGRDDATLLHLDDPKRWLGDRLQLVADLVQLARVLEGSTLHGYGHGVGGEALLGFATTRRDLERIVVGGVGGGLTDRLLEGERDGEPMEYALQVLLEDTKLSSWHPMLALMQYSQERADAIAWAEGVWKSPASTTDKSDVLHLYATDDDVVGASAQQALQRALGLPTVEPVLVDFEQKTTASPVSENLLNSRGDRVTGASVQLDGDHDVMWTDAGRWQAVRFLGSGVVY